MDYISINKWRKPIYLVIERTIKNASILYNHHPLGCICEQESWEDSRNVVAVYSYWRHVPVRIYTPKQIPKSHCDTTILGHQHSRLYLLTLIAFRHSLVICLDPSHNHRDDLSLLSGSFKSCCANCTPYHCFLSATVSREYAAMAAPPACVL